LSNPATRETCVPASIGKRWYLPGASISLGRSSAGLTRRGHWLARRKAGLTRRCRWLPRNIGQRLTKAAVERPVSPSWLASSKHTPRSNSTKPGWFRHLSLCDVRAPRQLGPSGHRWVMEHCRAPRQLGPSDHRWVMEHCRAPRQLGHTRLPVAVKTCWTVRQKARGVARSRADPCAAPWP